MSEREEVLFSERGENLNKWHLRKEIFVKGIELFGQIDPSRADSEESLKEVAIACAAIDRLTGDDQPVKEEQKKAGGKQKTMKSAWQRWTTENHTFTMVKVSQEEAKPFSGAVKEMLEKEDDHWIFLSLKYFFPGVPKPGEKAKPITHDQKLQNNIFIRELIKVWKGAKEELKLRVLESVSRAQQKAATKNRNDTQVSLDEIAVTAEKNTLIKLSIRQFKQWVEDDEDKKAEAKREQLDEKQQESKISHEQYVRKKDSLRIRLPPPDYDPLALLNGRPRPKSAGPKMSFGTIQSVRKKQEVAPQTTVDLMRNSGLKYVHATNKGRQGVEGDLEKSRKQLMERGFVDKDNFDVDPESEFNRETFQKMVENNPVISEIKQQQEKLIEESSKAYEDWAVLKANREQALSYLKLIPPPSPELKDRMDGTGLRLTVNPLSIFTSDALKDCIEIGELLKAVDRNLFNEWYQWANSHPTLNGSSNKSSQKGLSFNFATILWDYFEPRACDVHSAISSQVRETFMKLLRPGLDFRAAFRAYVGRRLNRGANRDLDEEEKTKMISSIALGRKDMQNLLIDVGVSMKKMELNALIDAFDQNGDGVVTLAEFMEFLGPTRDRNSGALATLKKKCCWRTTCMKTGMSNAYAVSEPTKEQLRKEGNNVLDDEKRSEAGSVRESTEKILGEKTELIRLANGESRLRVELAERKKREDILKRYGLLKSEETKKAKSDSKPSKKKANSDDEYQDDYEEEDGDGYGSDFDKPEDGDENQKREVPACAYSRWSMADRKKPLKRLADITKDARQEAALKVMLAEGTPPAAPKMWAAALTDIEVDESDPTALTTSMLIRWGPGDPEKDLISFYSLESAGKVGLNSRGDRRYTEIYRDPPDADVNSTFSLKHWIDNLEPGCSYALRIRGFNGFGPGPFTYKVCCTRSDIPLPPKIISVTHDSVTLKWVFSNVFLYQMQQLKKIFELADVDGSGIVSREELIAIFHDKENSPSSDLLKMVKKVLVKKGVDPDHGIAGVFDLIESDDDNAISWDEFEKFFVGAGFTNDSMGASKSLNLRNSGTGKLDRSINGPMKPNVETSKTNVSYVIEQCENEFTESYRECMKSTTGQCLITRLSPGQTYRFRVYGVNVDGVPGPKSESIIVHTMLETPSPPVLNGKSVPVTGMEKLAISTSVFPNKVVLRWRNRRDGVSSRDKGVIERMLGDWAGVGNDDGGVSIEVVFANYDRDQNGTIDPNEFVLLLQDLGVEVTEERLNEAFVTFDSNQDGKISFDEFSKWWRRDEVTYTLKRSEIIEPALPNTINLSSSTEQSRSRVMSAGANQSQRSKTPTRMSREQNSKTLAESKSKLNASGTSPLVTAFDPQIPMPVVCYHGDKTKAIEVAGLLPNSLYYFKLRYVGSRSNSALSSPLVLMTTPLACEPPILIYLTPTCVRIKWYSAQCGAHKFCVQMKNMSSRSTGSESNDDDYQSIFIGQENYWMSTTLAPDTVYAVRIIGVNAQGILGVPSSPLTFRTYPRDETKHLISARNVNDFFSIECTGDICVGDTILLTERLYHKTKSVNTTSSSGNTGGGGRAPENKSMTNKGLNGGTSVYSVSSTGRGGYLITGDAPDAGSFIGERTLAAHVIKDNYKTARISNDTKDLKPSKFSRTRRLWLEVIWQKASNESCKPYELKSGEVIERMQNHIEQFEVFRSCWIHEKLRKSLRDDLHSLSECFLQYPC